MQSKQHSQVSSQRKQQQRVARLEGDSRLGTGQRYLEFLGTAHQAPRHPRSFFSRGGCCWYIICCYAAISVSSSVQDTIYWCSAGVPVEVLAGKAAGNHLGEGSMAVAAAGNDPAGGSRRPGKHAEGEGGPGYRTRWRP
ncbi:hypothetical protein BDW74DRAFT_161477 [Aspergillus multicolor]|uniref:uncharacterized protein n=1 Tax=Aspergillus multicolor TaxID=41759 RepID=UPI003CCD4332